MPVHALLASRAKKPGGSSSPTSGPLRSQYKACLGFSWLEAHLDLRSNYSSPIASLRCEHALRDDADKFSACTASVLVVGEKAHKARSWSRWSVPTLRSWAASEMIQASCRGRRTTLRPRQEGPAPDWQTL
jgi:hypothetical protein